GVMIPSSGVRIDPATIPPFRGPTRHDSAQERKSGRSGRDDSEEKSGPPPSYGGRAEDEPYKRRRNPGAQARMPVPQVTKHESQVTKHESRDVLAGAGDDQRQVIGLLTGTEFLDGV